MIEKLHIQFEAMNSLRTIHVYLPPFYHESQERYPVIYMYDGHNLFHDEDATYGYSWHMEEFLDQYDKPFIVVGIECPHEGNQRLEEYCPYDVENSFLGTIHGFGQLFMDFVVEVVKPYIDNHYRTIPFRECTMIGGSSMGGLMSLYTIIAYNQYFSKAACLSSSIGICMDALTNEMNQHDLNVDTRVYLSWGSEESRNKRGLAYASMRNLEISHLLNQKHIMTYPYLQINGRHSEQSWQQQIPIFMDYLWKSK